MGAELGRVSGPLLSNNLVRYGIDLAFQNTDVSTPVLQLDVTNNRIGINNSSPTRDLFVNSYAQTTNLIVDTSSVFQNFTFLTNSISHVSDKIYISPNQSSNPQVVVPGLTAGNLNVDNNTITNLLNNADINLTPVTGGKLNVTGSVLVNGGLHSTGNITFDGDINLGNSDTDNITFNSDVASNIVPNAPGFQLGSTTKRFSQLNTLLVNGQAITSSTLAVGNIDLSLRPGKSIYVSINGNDSLVGNHPHAPFRTIKAALTAATSGDEIIIFPGTYTEVFPLTVPVGVSVKGAGIRAVTIQPTVGTQTQDCFLLNGETTVEFLTVANFYYNSVTNTGHAFRFASNMKVTTRSPYIFQVTVLTADSGALKAGKGVLADGSVVNSTSIKASMLFHAVTLITKGADALTMTNGVRIEWLNSFTYFALKGIYMTNGTLGFASQGSVFGAEIRSINSACVYGTYGVVADGANTLGYLIGHNFGYIGSGLDSSNDLGLVIQGNEVVKTNGGVIYYDSMDQRGTFRVGDIFSVDQDTGQVVLDAQAVTFANGGSIRLTTGGYTYIDAMKLQTGNIVIHDNNIESVSGPVNFYAFNGSTTLTTNVNVTGNLGVTGNFSVEGNITVGNEAFDTVSIIPRLGQTIKPNATGLYSLGNISTNEYWKDVYLTGTFDITNTLNAGSFDVLTGYFQVPDIKILANTLSVTQADTDLNLQANGDGGVVLDKIKITNTTIGNAWASASTDTQKSIIFSPNGTGNTVINSATAIALPVSNNAINVLDTTGQIRYNSSTNLFEGWQPSGLVSFKDLYSDDRQTYITAELTPGTNDNILRFATSNIVRATIDSTKLFSNILYSGNVSVSNNTISNTVSTNDVNFTIPKIGGNYSTISATRVAGSGAIFAIEITSLVYTSVTIINGGTGYDVGTLVTIQGSRLSGISPDNNLLVSVTAVNSSGTITAASIFSGVAVGTDGVYDNVLPSGVTLGTSATFDVTWATNASQYTLTVNTSGTGYRTGERYIIYGTQLGGTIPQNNLIFSIVASSGLVTGIQSLIQSLPFSSTTGFVNFANMPVKDNSFYNTTDNSLTLSSTGNGYIKFTTNGLVIPVGTTAQRRSLPEQGELRFNTDSSVAAAEIYNGEFWQPVKGSLPELSRDDIIDIMDEWTLILG